MKNNGKKGTEELNKTLPGGKDAVYTANNMIKFGKTESVKPFLVSADDIFKKSKNLVIMATDQESKEAVINYLKDQKFVWLCSPDNVKMINSGDIRNAINKQIQNIYIDLTNCSRSDNIDDMNNFYKLFADIIFDDKANIKIVLITKIQKFTNSIGQKQPEYLNYMPKAPLTVVYIAEHVFVIEYDDTPNQSFMKCIKSMNYDLSDIGLSVIEPNREEEEKNGQL